MLSVRAGWSFVLRFAKRSRVPCAPTSTRCGGLGRTLESSGLTGARLARRSLPSSAPESLDLTVSGPKGRAESFRARAPTHSQEGLEEQGEVTPQHLHTCTTRWPHNRHRWNALPFLFPLRSHILAGFARAEGGSILALLATTLARVEIAHARSQITLALIRSAQALAVFLQGFLREGLGRAHCYIIKPPHLARTHECERPTQSERLHDSAHPPEVRPKLRTESLCARGPTLPQKIHRLSRGVGLSA